MGGSINFRKDPYYTYIYIYILGNRGLPWFMFLLFWLGKLPEFLFFDPNNKNSGSFPNKKSKNICIYVYAFFFNCQ